VELHIEQMASLEKAGEQIGVVTAIAAPAYHRVTFGGPGGHAGALLMPFRHDALLGASELALEAEKTTFSPGVREHTVVTVGKLEVGPGAINSVPRTAVVHLDVRDIDTARRDKVLQKIHEHARRIAEARGLTLSIDVVSEDPAMTSDPEVLAAIQGVVETMGVRNRQMVSRAYHDTTFIGQDIPSSMIFIPCREGWSHRPDEFSSAEDIATGVEALARSLRALSDRKPASAEL
jgi:ureidoglycolate amidohydrolase